MGSQPSKMDGIPNRWISSNFYLNQFSWPVRTKFKNEKNYNFNMISWNRMISCDEFSPSFVNECKKIIIIFNSFLFLFTKKKKRHRIHQQTGWMPLFSKAGALDAQKRLWSPYFILTIQILHRTKNSKIWYPSLI